MAQSAVDTGVGHVIGVVRGVRRRWRWSRIMRGVAIALAGILTTLVLSALALEALHYAPRAVIAARVIALVVSIALLARFVVTPLLPRPRDEQVALFVEEHVPSFEGALISAIEISRENHPGREGHPERREGFSLEIDEQVRRMAIERARAVNDGRTVDARGTRLSFGALAGAGAMLLAVLTLGPDSLRYGMGALLTPWASAEEVNPFRVDVEPGDVTIARGASVLITARPVGFQAEGVEVWARPGDSTAWTRIPMTADSTSAYTARLLDVGMPTEYLVETTGLRSRTYKLSVADLPYAKRLDLEYRFPAYTGLPVQRVDSAGDIAAPAGTMVRVRVTPTVATPGGRLVVDAGDTLALVPAPDGTLSATLRVSRSGFYRVELEGARGDLLTASLNYAIDVLPDRPPSVTFARPGRDSRVLAVDEVFTEARAEDDYGVAKLELVFSVNGGPERSATLHRTAARVIKDIAAGHTFMLEDFALVPGDVVSYYASATDNDAVGGAKSATSDIYFLEVRPYAVEYRQDQSGGGGGGEGGGETPQQLSRRQREIIAGTFNTARDRANADGGKTRGEDIAALRLSQQRLRDDVEALARKLVERDVATMDSGLAKIAEILPVAAAAMDSAGTYLAGGALRAALPLQQRALQQLQRAEAEYRNVRVSLGGEGGGGESGGGGQQAEDLADLFELERERVGNQYETVQRGRQGGDKEEKQSAEVDAAAERLKQLAARQLQQNERAQRKADSLGGRAASGASGGGAQRQLAREVQEQARQLERLARDRQSDALAQAARRLNDASDAMRRSAASGGQQSASSAAAALDRLRDARRLLDQERQNRTQRAVDESVESGRRLAEEQRRVAEDVARQSGAAGQARADLQRSIEERKGALVDSARELARRLDRAAGDARREAPAVSREMQEAADTLRARRIEENIRRTREWVRRLPQETQDRNEQVIATDIARLNRALEDVRNAARAGRSADTASRNAAALERARDLVRGMESLEERAGQERERAQGQPVGGQVGRELRERLNDARALRRELSGRDVDLSQLDRAIASMEGLSNLGGSLADPRAERELRDHVITGLRAFEYTLGRAFGGTGDERALVDRAGEIPPEYRKYVEEYYRSLGRSKPR